MSLTIEDIRIYAKDIPEFNILLEGREQSSNPLISLAMRLACDDFNATPPKMEYTVDTFPSDSIMLYGTLHHLANAEAERQLRNQVDYQMQGLGTAVDNKFPQYNQLAQYYKGLFDAKLQQYKMYINTEACWGGEFSPLAAINEYQYRT